MSEWSRSAFRRIGRWRVLGVLMVLGAVAGLVVSATSRPVYTATAQSYVSSSGASSASDLQQGNNLAQQVQQSYASLATTPRVLDPVIGTLALRTTSEELAKRISVERPANTAVLEISASDPSAQRAAAIVSAVQTELARQVAELTPSKVNTRVTSVSRAQVPAQPSSPNAVLDVVLGALAGVVIWAAVLLVAALRRRRPPSSGGIAAPSML